jgi:hypothetical protein
MPEMPAAEPTGPPKKGRAGRAALLLAVPVVVAGVVVLTHHQNRAPTVMLDTGPSSAEVALEGVTELSFTAYGNDPDRDPLAFVWDFGDGTPAVTGSAVSHVFASAGTFAVTVTVSDGALTASGTTPVTVGSLDGTWVQADNPLLRFDLAQSGTRLEGRHYVDWITHWNAPLTGTLSAPRAVRFSFFNRDYGCTHTVEGTLSANLDTLVAQATIECAFSYALTLRRQ